MLSTVVHLYSTAVCPGFLKFFRNKTLKACSHYTQQLEEATDVEIYSSFFYVLSSNFVSLSRSKSVSARCL